MKIGVWLNNDMLPQEGGAYTYIHSLVKLLDDESFASADIVFITYRKAGESTLLKKPVIYLNEHFTTSAFFLKLLRRLSKRSDALNRLFTKHINRHISALIRTFGIDYVYYLNQAQRELETIPFIATNWDLAHLSLSTFPEFAGNGQAGKREKWYHGELSKATRIAVESEAGKEELVRYLKLDREKIAVVPFFIKKEAPVVQDAGQDASLLMAYGIEKGNYFYYPAQFWKHKNHSKLIKAFKLFHQEDAHGRKLVLTGSDKGELAAVKRQIEDLGLQGHVLCLGFVPGSHKDLLMSNALSLVMPTFLGPTNLPPLEAMEYNVPSVCSDLEGHREMLGNSALYFDPSSEQALYRALVRISDPEEYARQKEKLAEVKRSSRFSYDSAKHALDHLFTHLQNHSTQA